MPELLDRLPELDWMRLDLLGRLVLAAVLGGIIGLEREWSGKPAGFRTNLLICVGAALLTDLSLSIARAAGPGWPADPARLAAQIVSGVGFLGAGTIIQARGSITGLTTAATLWVVAAIGIAVGASAYVEAVGTTVLVMLSLVVLRQVEGRLAQRKEVMLRVTMARAPGVAEAVESTLGDDLSFQLTEGERREDELAMTYRVSGRRRHVSRLTERLLEIDGVHRIERD
ncbi:MAG TPA: MgtC/SapB family protein [Longimicrobiales bacterium]|nr:MgtC/SapB family protein [Longimicrobiales bacterium]